MSKSLVKEAKELGLAPLSWPDQRFEIINNLLLRMAERIEGMERQAGTAEPGRTETNGDR